MHCSSFKPGIGIFVAKLYVKIIRLIFLNSVHLLSIYGYGIAVRLL